MALRMSLTVNGEKKVVDLGDPRVTLLDFLREDLRLTGSKRGCDRGQCGACTVLRDGLRVNACLLLAISCEGTEITTIEGISDGKALHPVQDAFIKYDAFQCGYCTPGQIMSAIGLLSEGTADTDIEKVREGMSGNLCRCGAYKGITEAIISLSLEPDHGATEPTE